MPSSMIFASLVVIWLLILVPAVARHRQEVERPSVAALSGRVLERPRRRQTQEVDLMDTERAIDDVQQSRPVTTRTGRDDEPLRVPAAREADDDRGTGDHGTGDRDVADAGADWADAGPDRTEADPDAGPDDEAGRYAARDDAADDWDDEEDDRRWERPPPRYRPGRGGFDPEAAALAARARYAFRQRVVLALLVVALVTGVLAAVAVPGLWWPHATVDMVLVGYLVYLRRQVRMEEAIRERRAARMAGTRRPPAAEDPEPDADPDDAPDAAGRTTDDDTEDDGTGDAAEHVSGTGGAPDGEVAAEQEPALPRLTPAPPPPLPPGTALVEADEEDPELPELEGATRPDYRRAVGE